MEKLFYISCSYWKCKIKGENEYHTLAPPLEYHRNAPNSCCFSSLSSVLTKSGENSSTKAIAMRI